MRSRHRFWGEHKFGEGGDNVRPSAGVGVCHVWGFPGGRGPGAFSSGMGYKPLEGTGDPPKSWRGSGAVVSALEGLPPLSGPMPCSPHVQDSDLGMTRPSRSAVAEPRPLSPRFRAGETPSTLRRSVPWSLAGSGCRGHPGGRGRLGGPQVCTELAWLLTERACSRSFSPTPR